MDHFKDLKSQPIWTNYIRVWDPEKNKYRKPPINPKNLYNGSPTDPERWTDYATATANIGKTGRVYQNGKLMAEAPIEGVGIILSRPLTGIDIDHCIDQAGHVMPFAQKIVEDLDSYTEISPSGSGLHIFVLDEETEDLGKEFNGINADGSISGDGTAEIDAYNHKRYFTLTGKMYLDKPIRHTTGALRKILTEYEGKKRKASGTEAPAKPNLSPVGSGVTEENTRRMIESALEAIRPEDLDFGGWAAVGSALKQIGLSCGVWEDWSRDNGSNPKHIEGYTYKRWNKLKEKEEPERLIIGMAKKFGWSASDTFSTAERWAYGRSQHTPEELAAYARQKAEEEAEDRETDEEFMKDLQRAIAESKASQKPQEGTKPIADNSQAPNVPEVNARELSRPQAPSIDDIIKPIGSYVDEFIEECQHPQERHSTGFVSLDRRLNGGLFAELYILEAETSTGKSAISMAIAQNLVTSGMNVLYFALEMSRREFIARGASAISYEMTYDHNTGRSEEAVTAADILFYHYDPSMLPHMAHGADPFTKMAYSKYGKYVEEYRRRYEKNLFIIERPDLKESTGKAIADICKQFAEKHTDRPIAVFIDYLQILDGDDKDRKSKTDKNILSLKELCTKLKMPVFVISSVGRSGYGQGASIGNAKESGDIEYCGGVMLGWDWHNVTDHKNGDKKITPEKQKERDKKYGNRLMLMSLMKNRNSERDTQNGLVYYPKYNYFRELDDTLDKQRKEDDTVTIDKLLSGEIRL